MHNPDLHALTHTASAGKPVARLPTAVLATGIMLLAFLSLACGFILDTVTHGRRELKRLFPERPLAVLPRDHVIYKSFYLLNGAVGRVEIDPELYGIDVDERTVVICSRNDAGGAWSRDNVGRWMFDVVPGGDRQREMAFRFGVNVVMYALCLDYKRDQVHVPLILKRRTPYAP